MGTETTVHDGCIAKWITDGHVSVKGHSSQEEEFSGPQYEIEKGLSETAWNRNGFVIKGQVEQNLGDGGRGETNFQEREISEEEIHGGLETMVKQGDGDDEDVPTNGQEVDDEEKYEQEKL